MWPFSFHSHVSYTFQQASVQLKQALGEHLLQALSKLQQHELNVLPLFIQPLDRRWKGFPYPALSRRSHITPPPTFTPFPSRHRNHFASRRLHPAVPLSQAPPKGLAAGRYCSGQCSSGGRSETRQGSIPPS